MKRGHSSILLEFNLLRMSRSTYHLTSQVPRLTKQPHLGGTGDLMVGVPDGVVSLLIVLLFILEKNLDT